jgi:hypothetical protein
MYGTVASKMAGANTSIYQLASEPLSQPFFLIRHSVSKRFDEIISPP